MRPPYRGGMDWTGRPGSRVKEIGFEREREREREREIPEFPKPRRASAAVW